MDVIARVIEDYAETKIRVRIACKEATHDRIMAIVKWLESTREDEPIA
jgi:hypothetical protein